MFSSILAASFVAALVPQAFASLYVTSPVAGTTCHAGVPCNVTWNDDGTQPLLGQIGACTVGLYIGSQSTQIELQTLNGVNVATQATFLFTPDATVGGNSPLYFLRFTSTTLTAGQYNWEGFSAKFTLAGMTGTFNSTEASLMTAPTSSVASSTTGAVSTTSGSSVPPTTTGIVTTTAKPTGTTSVSKATAVVATTHSANAAVPAFDSLSHAVALVAVVVSAFFAAAAF